MMSGTYHVKIVIREANAAKWEFQFALYPQFSKVVGLPNIRATGLLESFNIQGVHSAPARMFLFAKIELRHMIKTDPATAAISDFATHIDMPSGFRKASRKFVMSPKNQFVETSSEVADQLVGRLEMLDQIIDIRWQKEPPILAVESAGDSHFRSEFQSVLDVFGSLKRRRKQFRF